MAARLSTAGRSCGRASLSCWALSVVAVALGPTASVSPAGPPSQQDIELVAATGDAAISFTHRYGAADKAYIMEMGGSGGAWLDYDVDGWVDLVLVNALPVSSADPPATIAAYERGELGLDNAAGHRFFRNHGGRFDDVTGSAGVGDVTWGNGAAVADVDNDGFPDLYVTAIGANVLYRNNGDGTFSRWASGAEDPRWGTSAAFTDWDGDGYVDLYVANYVDFDAKPIPSLESGACVYRGVAVHCGPEGLAGEVDAFYRNRGDGSFVPWPGASPDEEATFGLAVVATDCDDDRRPELYVASDSTINLLYRRGADGGLVDESLFSGAGYNGAGREQAGMSVAAADYDGDGDLDLFVTNFQHDYNTLYRNFGDCRFEDVSEQLGLVVSSLPYMGWGAQFLDVDGDGDQDIFVANGHVYPQLDAAGLEPWGQRNLLYVNQLVQTGEAHYTEIGESAGPGMQVLAASRSVLVADYDNDADLDLLVTNLDAAPTLLQNTGRSAAPALRLSLVGRTMNRSAYGARVIVESGGRSQVFELRGSDGYLGSNDPRLLIFLPGGVADRLHIVWQSGEVTTLENVPPGWLIVDEQRGAIARRD